MIKITVELWPPLMTGKKSREIARAFIINNGSGTEKRGNYNVRLWLKKKVAWKEVEIKNFPRESYNVWRLIKRILNEI